MSIISNKMTYFGNAAYYFTFDLMSKVSNAISCWNPSHDYTRVILPNYFDIVSIKLEDGTEKKYHFHKLLYGPMKTIDGKDVFKMRINDEAFWTSQWGIEYSPFRIVQKILKSNGLYLVDHTFGGQTPFVYIYKHLPLRTVIKSIPWHDHYNIPNLVDADFHSKKLSREQIIIANLNTLIQLQIKLAPLNDGVKDIAYSVSGNHSSVTSVIASEHVHYREPVIASEFVHVSSSVRSYRDALASLSF
jgi:hypothetical protein